MGVAQAAAAWTGGCLGALEPGLAVQPQLIGAGAAVDGVFTGSLIILLIVYCDNTQAEGVIAKDMPAGHGGGKGMQGIELEQDAMKEGAGKVAAIVRNLEFLEGELRILVFRAATGASSRQFPPTSWQKMVSAVLPRA